MLIYNSDGEHYLNFFLVMLQCYDKKKVEPCTCWATHVKLTFNLPWLGVVFQYLVMHIYDMI